MIMAELIGMRRFVHVKAGTSKFSTKRVDATVYGPLSVYRSIGNDGGYTVGHVETGFKLMAGLTEEQATLLVMKVISLDWTNVMRNPARHKDAVIAAAFLVRKELQAQ